MPPSVAIVVRCFNEEARIGRLLTGIARQTVGPDEIVIVDSGSTDATLAIAAAFPVRIVEIAPDDFSFGRALNLGLTYVNAELAVLASAHVYPIYDSWIAKLVAPFEDPSVGLSYGRQQTPPGACFSEHRLLAQWFPATSESRQRHPFCNNANACIRRSVWQQQPYDEQLTGLEDLDWAKRALAAGHVASYVAEAPVTHIHDEGFEQIVNRYRREAIAYKAIYSEQRMGPGAVLRRATSNIRGDLVAARSAGVLTVPTALDIARFRSAQFYGTYRGFAQQGARHPPARQALLLCRSFV
jgi:glycosyltransferase involved in cell wall biosynthesis